MIVVASKEVPKSNKYLEIVFISSDEASCLTEKYRIFHFLSKFQKNYGDNLPVDTQLGLVGRQGVIIFFIFLISF